MAVLKDKDANTEHTPEPHPTWTALKKTLTDIAEVCRKETKRGWFSLCDILTCKEKLGHRVLVCVGDSRTCSQLQVGYPTEGPVIIFVSLALFFYNPISVKLGAVAQD